MVKRFVLIVLASKEDTPSCALTFIVETVAVLAVMLEPIMVEKPSCALTFIVETVAVLAVMLDPIMVEKPI